MKKLVYLLVLILISSIYPQFGRWNNYHNYSSWKKVLEQIPKPGLKLLVNPALQMGTTTSINSRSLNLKLGNNIVTNGDFHDFTFDATPRAQKNVSTVFIDTVEYVVGTETSPYSNSYVEDGTCWEVEEVSGSPGIDVRMTFIIPEGEVPDSVTIKAYYSGTANRSVYLELWNKTTSTWDSVTTVTLDEELDTYTIDLDPNHVFDDTLTMRFYHPDNGNPSYYLCVDYLAVTTEIQGVVAYWVFDDIYHTQEGTGKTVIQDLSGNGHDLSIGGWTDYNDLLTDMTGESPIYQGGHGLKFSGVNEYLYILGIQAEDFGYGAGDFTWEVWIKPYSYPDWRSGIIVHELYPSRGFRSGIDFEGKFRFWTSQDGGNIGIMSQTVLQIGQWYHVAFAVKNNGSDYTVSLYINGNLEDSSTGIIVPTSKNKLLIGCIGGVSNFFHGEMAALRYSSKALTEQEIKESYGLAKGWTWDGVGSVRNDNFRQVVSGGGTITQTVATTSGTMYKKNVTTNDTTTVSYLNEDNYTISLGDGTHDNVSVRPVLNAVKPVNFVEDFSKGGARYVEITAENQGTQSTSQIYANSTKTNYYWGDGSSAEVIGDFRVTNGNHGIMINNLEDDQPAHPAAFKYNGIDQYVNFGDVCNVGTNDFIVFVWFEQEVFGVPHYIIAKGGYQTGAGYHIRIAATNQSVFAVSDGTNYIEEFPFIPPRKFNFVAMAWDYSAKTMRIYFDGSLVQTVTNTNITGSLNTTVPFNMGAKSSGIQRWGGKIGLSGIYIFDGQDGAPNDLTESMGKKLIREIYNITDGLYLQE